MTTPDTQTEPSEIQWVTIENEHWEVIKPTRLLAGSVIRSRDHTQFGRIGPKIETIEEQIHAISLYNRGFPVPKVLSSGEIDADTWYFTEQSLGIEPFHKIFRRDTREMGEIQPENFDAYLSVLQQYVKAQMSTNNRSTIRPEDFITALIPDHRVVPNIEYFGHDTGAYKSALNRVAQRLEAAPMGILQYDLNPYNVLEQGVIDFELVGFGPIGYDSLISARWSEGWFTAYPSKYPIGYKLTEEQLSSNDAVINETAHAHGLDEPSKFLQEFLLLKSAWALSSVVSPSPALEPDRLAFRHFRANLLDSVVRSYLDNEPIDFRKLSTTPGGELNES